MQNYLLYFNAIDDKKLLRIGVKRNMIDLLNKDEKVQKMINEYTKRGYMISTFVSGTKDIYDTYRKLIEIA